MRIALVAHSDAPWTPHYARAFREAGHELLLVSFCPDPVAGVENVFVGRRPYDPARGKHLFVTRAPRVRRALRAWRPDAVLATYLSSDALAAALAFRGPLVVSARGADVLEQAGRLPAPPWLHRQLLRFVCGRATRVHAVSQEIAEALAAIGIARERIVCFPAGVDVESLARLRAWRTPAPEPRILCTRRQEPVYENHVLVEALARLRAGGRRVRARLVGGGTLLDARREQAKALGLGDGVELVGQVPPERIPDLLGDAEIYVSAASSDGTSSSLLEALAAGLFPVVTRIRANVGWIREGETGLLFEPGDVAGLARALGRALDDAGLRARAAAANLALVAERGDRAANMRRMLALLEEAVGEGRSVSSAFRTRRGC